MEAEIGDAAGTIWQYLAQHGETSLAQLRQETKLADQLLFMGLGWLAREGKRNSSGRRGASEYTSERALSGEAAAWDDGIPGSQTGHCGVRIDRVAESANFLAIDRPAIQEAVHAPRPGLRTSHRRLP